MRTGNYLDDDYFGAGILVGGILTLLVVLIGFVIFCINYTSARDEFGLYKALETKEFWQEKAEQNKAKGTQEARPSKESDEMKIYRIIRTIALTDSKEKSLKLLAELRDSKSKSLYESMFLQNCEKITKLAKGEIENLSSQVKFPSFWNYLFLFLILSWLSIVVCVTVNFVSRSIYEKESLFALPWENPWTYGLIALMLPGILPCFAVEGSMRGIAFLAKEVRHENLRGRETDETVEHPDGNSISPEDEARMRQARNAENKQQREVLDERVSCGRQNAEIYIKNAHERMPKTQERWKTVFLEHLSERMQELQNNTAAHRNNLHSLGKTITSEQKNLALAEDELKRWKDGIEALKQRKSEEHIQELNRILNLQHVMAVEVKGNCMSVFTDTLYINYDGNRYEIGMFAINIRLDTTSVDGISVQNFASTHPHDATHPYGSKSSICWGVMADPISNMIQQKEYAVAIDFILQAMQSAEGDRPTNVLQWRQTA